MYLRVHGGQPTEGRGADVVVDQVGGDLRRASLVVLGNASGAEDSPISPLELWFSSKGVLGFNLHLVSSVEPHRAGDAMREALARVAAGEVKVDVTDVLPLCEAAEAHRRIERRSTTGKLVLRIR